MTTPLQWVRECDPTVLTQLADGWVHVGSRLEEVFATYLNEVTKVEGTHWEGAAAQAAQDRADGDSRTMQALADKLEALAQRVRLGYDEIDAPLQRARGLLAEAEGSLGAVAGPFLHLTPTVTNSDIVARVYELQTELQQAAQAAMAADVAIRDALNGFRPDLAAAFTSPAALGSAQAEIDGQSLIDDPSNLSAEATRRLIEAGQLTPEQLAALNRGETATIPAAQMEYLTQISRSLDGKSPQEIEQIMSKLPPDTKQALANSFQLISNQKINAGVTTDPSIPKNGSLEQLPKKIQESLGRKDGLLVPAPALTNHRLTTDDYQQTRAILDIVGASDDRYQVGSDLDRGLLEKAGAYMEASSTLHQLHPGEYDLPETERLMTDIFTTVGDDKAAVQSVVTDPDKGPEFIENVLRRSWADDGKAAAGLFTFGDGAMTVEDPNNKADVRAAELSGNIMSSVGKYIADDGHWKQLMDLSGDNSESVGQRNPLLVQQLATSMSPFIDELAGGDRPEIRGFDSQAEGRTSWIDPDGNGSFRGARNVFSLMDTDDEAGRIFIQAAAEHARANEVEFAHDIGNNQASKHVVIAGRIDGLIDGGLFDEANDRIDDKDQAAKDAYKNKEEWFNTGKSVAAITVKTIPFGVGDVVWDLADGQTDPIKESIIGPEPESGDRPQLARTDDAFRIHNVISQAHVSAELQQDYPKLFENGALKSWHDITTGSVSDVELNITNLRNLLDTLDGVNIDSEDYMNDAYGKAASGLPGRDQNSDSGGR